jgi:DNA-binding transcriptional regulator LsrR (DeoR family)
MKTIPKKGQLAAVFRAIVAGMQTEPEIAGKAGIPSRHVHPLIARLRARGLVCGRTKSGNLRPTRAAEAMLE